MAIAVDAAVGLSASFDCALEAGDAEQSAVLGLSFDDSVGYENETLSGVELAVGRCEAGFGVV